MASTRLAQHHIQRPPQPRVSPAGKEAQSGHAAASALRGTSLRSDRDQIEAEKGSGAYNNQRSDPGGPISCGSCPWAETPAGNSTQQLSRTSDPVWTGSLESGECWGNEKKLAKGSKLTMKRVNKIWELVQYGSLAFSWALFIFFFFSLFFRAAPVACGSSQARSRIGAVAAGLRHSHSNARSELHLRPTPWLMV